MSGFDVVRGAVKVGTPLLQNAKWNSACAQRTIFEEKKSSLKCSLKYFKQSDFILKHTVLLQEICILHILFRNYSLHFCSQKQSRPARLQDNRLLKQHQLEIIISFLDFPNPREQILSSSCTISAFSFCCFSFNDPVCFSAHVIQSRCAEARKSLCHGPRQLAGAGVALLALAHACAHTRAPRARGPGRWTRLCPRALRRSCRSSTILALQISSWLLRVFAEEITENRLNATALYCLKMTDGEKTPTLR